MTRQEWIDKRITGQACDCFNPVISEKDKKHCLWCGKELKPKRWDIAETKSKNSNSKI